MTNQAQVIFRDTKTDEIRRGWMSLDELIGRTFLLEDGWLDER